MLDLAKRLPAFRVVLVHLSEFLHGESRRLQQVTRFEHKGHVRVRDFVGFLLAADEFVVGISVRAMRSHGGVKGGASRGKSLTFCIVFTANIAHKLTHAVTMVVWRLESVFSN